MEFEINITAFRRQTPAEKLYKSDFGGVELSDNLSAFNAAEYDEQIKRTLPYYEELYTQVVNVVNVCFHRPVRWLDIGCGTGKMEEVALESCKIEEMTAYDISPKMIEITNKRFQDQNVKCIKSSVFDMCDEASFDVVTAIQVFHYLNNGERAIAIRKCYDALKPNGVFITFENFAPNSKIGENLFLERWRAFQSSQGKSIEECDQHISRYKKAYFPITIPEHLELLKRSGFENSEILWISNMQVGLLGIK